jgi:hypothetical protein
MSSSRFVSSFIVVGVTHDDNSHHIKEKEEQGEGEEEASSSSSSSSLTSNLKVMRLPARYLLKEVLTTLELSASSLSSAADIITANLARQLVIKMKGSSQVEEEKEGGLLSLLLPSNFFWNLMVIFEEMRLPSGYLVWFIRE